MGSDPFWIKGVRPPQVFYLPLFFFIFLHVATTYIIKEGEVEVGRWVEEDGKDGTEILGVDGKTASTQALPASPPETKTPSRPTYPWYSGKSGYETAIRNQKNTGQPVGIYFYTDWCGYCKEFDKDVLKNGNVISAMKYSLRVRINVEEEEEIAKTYGVDSFPRFYVRDKSGGVKQLTTHSDPKRFLDELARANLIRR